MIAASARQRQAVICVSYAMVAIVLVSVAPAESRVAAAPSNGYRADIAQEREPVLRAINVTTATEQWIGRRWLIVRGLVINDGPGRARWTSTRIDLKDTQGQPLGIGIGHVLVPLLDEGEDGPFEIRMPLQEDDTPAAARPEPLGVATDEIPYRGLLMRELRMPSQNGESSWRFELLNDGDGYVEAAELNVHAAFFEGGQLVALRAAAMPIRYGPRPGQVLGPGRALPALLVLPEVVFDEVRWWLVGRTLPDDVFPVPIGLIDVVFDDRVAAEGLRADALIVNCGFQRVQEMFLVAIAYESSGDIAGFIGRPVVFASPVEPGGAQPLQITLSGYDLPPGAPLPSFEVFAMAEQPVPPTTLPCVGLPEPYGRAWLPALSTARLAPVDRPLTAVWEPNRIAP